MHLKVIDPWPLSWPLTFKKFVEGSKVYLKLFSPPLILEAEDF